MQISLSCPLFTSYRVQQVAGMFDVPLGERLWRELEINLPDDFSARAWRIGLIVGPSGSGKTTVARRLFGDSLARRRTWPRDQAVIDGFGERPIKQIVALLTAVGFSSPPSWIKPYRVLSAGEQFRCDLARAICAAEDEGAPLAVVDEFTSVVDRRIARVVAAALAKAVRGGLVRPGFVGVTCHDDVAAWLAPDWVLDMATGEFRWGCLRRPAVRMELSRCRRGAWAVFAPHHYLSGELPRGARCFQALWEGSAAAFCASVPLIGRKNRWRIGRIVTLPDCQGIGIGAATVEAVADLHRDDGHRVSLTASHPALVAHCRRSPRWRAVRIGRPGGKGRPGMSDYRGSTGRMTASFEYLGGT